VPITYVVYDYHSTPNSFAFDNSLSRRVFELIKRHSNQRPTLVFCSTRKGVETCAKIIVEAAKDEFVKSAKQRDM
jgi:ATP-dependent DNA helicase HFM1/MER3